MNQITLLLMQAARRASRPRCLCCRTYGPNYSSTCALSSRYNGLRSNFKSVNLPIDKLFSLIDFLGVFVGAFGGALAAVRDTRYKYDLVGVTGLALTSALGGGITRDLILQKGPPLAFADARYLITALAGAMIGMVFAQRSGRTRSGPSSLLMRLRLAFSPWPGARGR